MRREAWLTEDDTLRLLTARDQSSISIPRWLLWCFLSCLPERPQKAGDWPGGGEGGGRKLTTQRPNNVQDGCYVGGEARLTGLVDPAEGMSGVVFARLEAAFAEIKVITVFALEPWAVNGKHLTAITPVGSKKF